MATKKQRGGARPGAGGPRRNINLSKGHARTLRLITKMRRDVLRLPELTEDQVVESLIDQEWREIDREFQRDAEIAQEPYIL